MKKWIGEKIGKMSVESQTSEAKIHTLDGRALIFTPALLTDSAQSLGIP